MKQSTRLDKAAKLADLMERHFAKLPASERAVREKAFHEAAVKVGTRAKSEEPKAAAGRSARPTHPSSLFPSAMQRHRAARHPLELDSRESGGSHLSRQLFRSGKFSNRFRQIRVGLARS